MTQDDFNRQLEAIAEEARVKVVDLVEKARNENADGFMGDEPVDWIKPSVWQAWEKTAERFAELCGWTIDRLNGRRDDEKKSVSRKLRGALGYNQNFRIIR